MTLKTEALTAREIAKIDSAPRINALQIAALAAAKRTGLRIGLAVDQGTYRVQALAFAVNGAGKATGSADARELAAFPTSDVPAVIAYLDAMA